MLPQVSQRKVVHRGFSLLRVLPIQAFLIAIIDAKQQDTRTSVFSLSTPVAPLINCQETRTVYFGATYKWKAGFRGASTADVDVEPEATTMGSL